MTKHNAKDFLPLVQALADGKTIQCKAVAGAPWMDLDAVSFTDPVICYRIKPEPRRFWLVAKYPKVEFGVWGLAPSNPKDYDEVIEVVEVLK